MLTKGVINMQTIAEGELKIKLDGVGPVDNRPSTD